jgi:hypothetical protein
MSLVLRRPRLLVAALAVALVAGTASVAVAAAPAVTAASAPGSIVYVKDFNVWIANGDGSGERQVTSGGTAADPWQSPTQADNGVVVAHRSGLIHRMNQYGQTFNVMDPPDLPDAIGNRLSGRDLTETAISPDGSRIAYTYFKFSLGEKRWATGFTTSGAPSDPGQWGIAFYDKPAWVTNNRVVVNAWYRNRTHLYDLGANDAPWFSERDYQAPVAKELSDLEVSRDGKWVTAVRGEPGDEGILVARVNGNVKTGTPGFPSAPCEFGVDDPQLREPTFAPDSSAVAWAEPDGIWTASRFDCDPSTVFRRIIAGGSDPSWSPAVIGATPPGPVATPSKPAAVKPAIKVHSKPRITGSARVKRTLKAKTGSWSPRPTAYAYQWMRNGKKIAKATKRTYRVTKKDRRRTITVRVTAKRTGYASATSTSRAVRIKR